MWRTQKKIKSNKNVFTGRAILLFCAQHVPLYQRVDLVTRFSVTGIRQAEVAFFICPQICTELWSLILFSLLLALLSHYFLVADSLIYSLAGVRTPNDLQCLEFKH